MDRSNQQIATVSAWACSDRVLPRLVDLALGARTDELRAKMADGLSDTVLEVGFGSGRNLPHLSPAVRRSGRRAR